MAWHRSTAAIGQDKATDVGFGAYAGHLANLALRPAQPPISLRDTTC
jgi:hypothetical protein